MNPSLKSHLDKRYNKKEAFGLIEETKERAEKIHSI
jgi:hypothetical protein